jgi:hypothetical protein
VAEEVAVDSTDYRETAGATASGGRPGRRLRAATAW